MQVIQDSITHSEEAGGGLQKDRIVNEFIAVLASYPSHLLDDINGFNYAPQLRQLLIDNGFHTVNKTLRAVQRKS